MGKIQEFKESFVPTADYLASGHRAEIWYAAETQRYRQLVDSGQWLSEMDGYGIRDNLDEIPTTEVGKNTYPGHMAEIMNIFGDFIAGPWESSASIDLEMFKECLNRKHSKDSALLCAEMAFLLRQDLREKQRKTALYFLRRAGEKAISGGYKDRETLARVTRIFSKIMAGSDVSPISVGFQPVIEDSGMQNDLDFTRCEIEDMDNWAEKQAVEKSIEYKGPSGICLDRVREMQQRAFVRRLRFFRLFDFICRGNKAEVERAFRWAPSSKKHGRLWLRIDKEHRLNPEPGLVYLTKSQTVILSFMARRRLGWKVSAGLVKSARWACENLLWWDFRLFQSDLEMQGCPVPDNMDIEDFNICDLEANVNGYSKFLVELTKWARSGYAGKVPESKGG